MNLKVNYFENSLNFDNDRIQVIEIENKKMFYRFISDLYEIKNDNELNELYFYNDKNEELDLSNKIEIYTNFFDLNINSKKIITSLNKTIIDNLSDNEKDNIFNNYKKIYKSLSTILSNFDLPLTISDSISIEDIIKVSKVSISIKNDLLENLLLLIDIEKTLKLNKILFFINLKQYLNKDELLEFYKYAIYNNINIVLIDSQGYGVPLNFEKKLIIDSELEEFML